MSDQISVVYQNIRIEYDEDSDIWKFELRNRARSADTLAKAKEFIDKPEPAKNAFTPITAWLRGGYVSDGTNDFILVTVTSIAQSSRYSSVEVFIRHSNGKREKVNLSRLMESNEKNARLIAMYQDVAEKIRKLKEENRTREEQMKLLKIEEEQ